MADAASSTVKRSRPSWFSDVAAAVVLLVVFWLPPLLSAARVSVICSGAVLAAVTAGAMVVRWRLPSIAPVLALCATGMGWMLRASSDPMLGFAWCLYPLALRHEARSRVIGSVAVAVMIVICLTHGAPSSGSGMDQRIIVAAVCVGAVWLLGQAEARRLQAVNESAERRAAYERALHQASMAREVHDVVGHALSVISAEADVSRSLPQVGATELRESLADIELRARGALEEVQGLVRALRHGAPGSGDATPIRQLVTAAEASGIEVEARLDEADMSEATRRVVSRVVQEALSNVVRHAHATRCEVAVWQENETVRVRVDDDGVGLSPRYRPGTGLTGMRERVGGVGGSVTVTNRLEGGTRLLATVPAGADA